MSKPTTIDQSPVKALLKFKQGTDVTFKLRWLPGGLAVDLSGWKAMAHFSETLDDATPLFTLTTENAGITMDSDGGISLVLPSSTTSALETLTGVFDLELESPSHKIRCLVDGTWEMGRQINHG